jgi:phosphoribosylformylglycinamidine synthase PurS subunit
MKLHSGGTNMTKVNVYVTLRESVVDPQGIATTDALKNMGFAEVESVRIGKLIELELDEKTTDIDARVKEMCDKLLINKVIEDYRYEIEEA